jgi:hypothetical protein
MKCLTSSIVLLIAGIQFDSCLWAQDIRQVERQLRAIVELIDQELVANELEIVGNQISEIRALRNEHAETMSQIMENSKDGDFMERFATATKNFDTEVNKILIPSQMKRLKQIANQRVYQVYGVDFGLLNKKLAEQLELTQDQKTQIRTESEKNADELKKKIQKLENELQEITDKNRTKLLRILTPDQRDRYENLVGPLSETQLLKFQIPMFGTTALPVFQYLKK